MINKELKCNQGVTHGNQVKRLLKILIGGGKFTNLQLMQMGIGDIRRRACDLIILGYPVQREWKDGIALGSTQMTFLKF